MSTRFIWISMSVILYGWTISAQEHHETPGDYRAPASGVIGELREFRVTDESLIALLQLRNHSPQDIWICEDTDTAGLCFEVQLGEKDAVLLIRRRFSVPTAVAWSFPPTARYVRLHRGESRTESLVLPIPIRQRTVFLEKSMASGSARRIAVEIGYCCDDLRKLVPGLIVKAKESDVNDDPLARDRKLLRLVYFNNINEGIRNREEYAMVPYGWLDTNFENVLRIEVDGANIQCLRNIENLPPDRPDITPSGEWSVSYHPSMLDCLYPFASEQTLLTAVERDQMRLQTKGVFDDPDIVEALWRQILAGSVDGGIIAGNNVVTLECRSGSEPAFSFSLYGDADIETSQKQRLRYRHSLDGLRLVTRGLQPIETRIECATNLRNLWYRYHLYHHVADTKVHNMREDGYRQYLPSATWCDEMLRPYIDAGISGESTMRPFRCPSADSGRCHYSMNSNCTHDSPPDTVLLFETTSGWNQHGGLELFTFDNHDPKGGCILLNDGTVKFIRTEEELKQLRWK